MLKVVSSDFQKFYVTISSHVVLMRWPSLDVKQELFVTKKEKTTGQGLVILYC